MIEGLKSIIARNKGFIAIVITILVVRSILIDQYHVPSGSMIPTIKIGDRILVNKLAYVLRVPFTDIVLAEIGEPDPGDIIVFNNPDSNIVMIKRLIGRPGDVLNIDNGFVKVNGQVLLDEDRQPIPGPQGQLFVEHYGEYKYFVQRLAMVRPEKKELTVPEDHFFFMGDNRDNSHDSRYWSNNGMVHRHLLKGHALRVTFSLDGFVPRIRRFGADLYADVTIE